MAALDQLSIEIHHLIFGYLDLIEISTCRLVSKSLNENLKAFRVRELFFYNSVWQRKTHWHHDRKPIYPNNSLSKRKLSVLSSTSIDPRYLKRLAINNPEKDFHFGVEVVNRFENLVHLELFFEYRSDQSEIRKLKLNHLRRLYIYLQFPIFIEFDTPKLESVAIEYQPVGEIGQPIETIRFATPSTVKWLETFRLRPDQLPRNLCGVEHLQFDALEIDLKHVLNTFPALKVLNLVLIKGSSKENCNDALDRILKQRSQLRPSLKICFESVALSKTIGSYGIDKESKLALLIKNSSSLLETCFLEELNYNELLSLTKNGYPIGFLDLQPFYHVYLISANDKIDDPYALLNFLLNCVNLSCLELKNSSLGMEFFDRLPSFTSLLRLKIEAENRDLQLDFAAFLSRMTNLADLVTDQNLDASLLRDLMQTLKFVLRLIFKINGQTVLISKMNEAEDLYDLCHKNGHLSHIERSIDRENLIKYFDSVGQ